ncbi:MAG: B12-binding domain-containing radical SAM protein [Chlamydiae bacterium]|nr:B12-binding domain-containing radical SAM protein [Chlamydiota bacterium]
MLFELEKKQTVTSKNTFSVLLISPGDFGSYRSSTFVTENLGIEYLAAYLSSNDINVTICDARSFDMSPEKVIEKIKGKDFDLIGLSIASREGLFWSLNFVKLFRNIISQNTHITAGGQFSTLETQELFDTIPQIDSIIMGEGEIGLLNLCHALIKKGDWKEIKGLSHVGHISNDRDVVLDLDSLPFPYRYLAFEKDESYEVLLEGSRGCVFCCSFCAIRPFLGKKIFPSWRIRSASSLIEEIKYIKNKNNKLKKFRFIDSDFIGPANNARAIKFAEIAKAELRDVSFHMEGRAASIVKNKELLLQLKDAGLKRVYVGIESGSQRILDKMNKRTSVQENKNAIDLLKELSIDFSYGFIMFTPWTIDKDIEDNLDILRYFGKIQMNKLFHELFLIKGTKAYEEVSQNIGVKRKRDSGYYTYPALTENVARIREIGEILEYEKVEFMQKLWFLYKRLRELNFLKIEDIEYLEQSVDRLFVDIFEYCWNFVKEDPLVLPSQVVDQCIHVFIEKIEDLHKNLYKDGLVFLGAENED